MSQTSESTIDQALQAIIDLEQQALGDHCLPSQLRPILAALLTRRDQPDFSKLSKDEIAHSLTLQFGRVLEESEWREVVDAARRLPFVQGLEAAATWRDQPEPTPMCWEALAAARDALVGFQKQAGSLPAQGGYSTRMTEAEMKLAQAVESIDVILATRRDQPEQEWQKRMHILVAETRRCIDTEGKILNAYRKLDALDNLIREATRRDAPPEPPQDVMESLHRVFTRNGIASYTDYPHLAGDVIRWACEMYRQAKMPPRQTEPQAEALLLALFDPACPSCHRSDRLIRLGPTGAMRVCEECGWTGTADSLETTKQPVEPHIVPLDSDVPVSLVPIPTGATRRDAPQEPHEEKDV